MMTPQLPVKIVLFSRPPDHYMHGFFSFFSSDCIFVNHFNETAELDS